MRQTEMKRGPALKALWAGVALTIVACSSSDATFPAGDGGAAGAADASVGGAGGSGAGAGTGSQAGGGQGGDGGSSAGGSGLGGAPQAGNGGSAGGGAGGASTGGSAGSDFGGSGGTSNAGAGGSPTGGSGGGADGGSGGTSNAGAGGSVTGGAGGSPDGGSGGTSNAGAGGSPDGGSGGTSTGGGAGAGGAGGMGGSGGLSADSGVCGGQTTTVEGIAADAFPENTLVSVTGAIATSPKFQVTNACLWGVFVKGPGSNAGAFLISQGTQIGGVCNAGTDQIPQGILTGDIIDFGGRIVHFMPVGCTGVPPLLEVQLDAADGCTAIKTGSGPAPVPVDVLPSELLDGTQHPNQLVRIWNVSLQDLPDGGVVDAQGTIFLQGSGLAVRDSIFWRIQGAPQVSSSQFFNSITGINSQPMPVNGVCAYTLLPRNKCADFVPKSLDCP